MKRLDDFSATQSTNRITDAIYMYAEQETQSFISNPLASRNLNENILLKLQYYNGIYNAYRKTADREEKRSLRYIKHEVDKMSAKLHPTTINRILYSEIFNSLRNFINGNNIAYKLHNEAIKRIETDLIEQHNIRNLSHEMKKNGFKLELEGTMTKLIKQNLPQFHVRYTDIQNSDADFVLHFKKLPNTNIYYFEKFDAISRPSLDALLNNDPSCTRYTFELTAKIKFNAKEASNLVNGRAVCKSIDDKDTWLMIDASRSSHQIPFKQISFDLEKALGKLPIKQLDNTAQSRSLVEALRCGSHKEVTFTLNGQQVKYNIQAAPLQKGISIIDNQNRLVDSAKLLTGKMQGLTAKLLTKNNQQEDIIDLGQQHRQNRKSR